MGNVALLAGSYLLQQIRAVPVAEIESGEFFDVQGVEVRDGVAAAARLPRCLFFEWRDPRRRRDLLLFVGEAQPSANGYALCRRIMDYVVTRGVKRFFTFAAMATQLHPGDAPRVFVAATDPPTLDRVKEADVEVLEGGQITGLNGLLLAAGAERGLQGACLLGELPYFAVSVPNPRAAKAVLERFAALVDLQIDLDELDRQAQAVEADLLKLMEQLTEAAAEASDDDDDEDETGDGDGEGSPSAEQRAAQANSPPRLDPKTKRRIESLFEKAGQDRSRAFELKQELDRLGVFKQYENRFLDLFRKAE
jgi:proteasome assembly chaperone (PAC2) family protein